METVGLIVRASDLVERDCDGDVRSFYDFPVAAPAIVTSPPFAERGWDNGKAHWLKHVLDVLDAGYMALLLNWTWPRASGLAPFWSQYPPARVYHMRWKIDFTGQGAPPVLNGWFVRDKTWAGETVLRMLDRRDARQSELFSGEAA